MENGYLNIDASVEDELYREAESIEREIIEEGLTVQNYFASMMSVAENPVDLREKAIKSGVWIEVKGENPEIEYDDFETEDEPEFTQEITLGPEDDSGLLDELLNAFDEDTTTASFKRSRYTDNIVVSLNDFGTYEELLQEFSPKRGIENAESVEYFVKTQGKARGLKRAIDQLEENGIVGIRVSDEDSDTTFAYKEGEAPEFIKLDQLNPKYDSKLF